ncbi:MAG TPA: DUF3352 domain-containing protein [Candidatus Limnocylindrales bacterium]|nr:DUF3352 domain-containing protein [Candidatus Limnocylindrales bacterium]
MTSPETGRGNDQPRPDSTPPSPDPQTSQWTPPPAPSAPLPPIGTAPESYGWNPPAPPPEPRRRGWLLPVAGLVLLLIVAAIGVYVFLNQGRTTGPDAARAGYAYLPADSAMAMELRLDLPAGQREQFVRFATRFPQFGDAGQVERQIDQLLNEAIATASGGMANYEDDVKPWFAGWIVAGGSMPAEVGAPPPFVVILGSTNRPAAEVAVERLRGADSWTSQAGPGGVTIWTGSARFDRTANSYAVTDDAVVLGADSEAVQAALQRKASDGESLLAGESFSAALGRQPAGRLAMFWLDYQALADAIDDAGPQGPIGNPFQLTCPGMAEPRSISGSLYMQDGRASMELVLENAPGGPAVQMRDSGLSQRLPGDTFFYFSAHDVGSNVTATLSCLREQPMFGEQLRELETQLGQPIDQLVSWAGDVAVGVRFDGSRATAGLVVNVTDQGRAAEAMGQVRALITAAGGGQGAVSVLEEDYNGARIVTFRFKDQFGGGPQPPMPDASLAYAFAGDLLVIGMDASFARAVVDTQAANSLASREEYRRAIDAAGGTSNAGAMYLDFEIAWQLVESAMGPMMGGGFMDSGLQEMRAVIGSLESLAMVGRVDGDTAITRIVLTTRDE